MVTDQQIGRLFKLLNTEETQEIAASKAGMDVKTARRYLKTRRLPSEMKGSPSLADAAGWLCRGVAGDQ